MERRRYNDGASASDLLKLMHGRMPEKETTMQELRDALLNILRALPNGAATVTSTAIDTGKTTKLGHQSGDFEFKLTAPALTTAQLADAKTMKYNILFSDKDDLSSPTTYIAAAITQTGAGGAGGAAAEFRFRIPSNAGRYVFYTITGSAAGDASGANATLEVLV